MKPILATAVLAGVMFMSPTAHAIICTVGGGGSSSENFGVDRTVVGAGGGTSGSSNFSVEATIGQPTENVEMSSPGFSSGSGLWNTLGTEGDAPVFDNASCSGDFSVYSLTDYDAYVASDFGRSGGNKYQHLIIATSLSEPLIAMVSPCRIELQSAISLVTDTLVLNARQAINAGPGISLDVGEACLTSTQDKVKIGNNLVILGQEIVFTAKKATEIGDNADFQNQW